jgi:glycine/D-amino acid oxidase-like deaminating enzyme
MWDLPPAELAAYAEEHGRWGYRMRWVDRVAALRIEPNLKAPPERALHILEEGMVEPVFAARALLAGAMAQGARFLERTRVASLLLRRGRVAGVATEAGATLEADETVVAAGADTARLLATIGVQLQMSAPAGLIMHSTVVGRRLLRGLVMAPEFHMRQTREGRIIVGTDFAGGDPQGRDQEMARDLLAKLRVMLAGAENLEVGFVTVGNRPTPADSFPAIGRVRDGLYVTVLHSGVTLAPLVGELAAREIAIGERDHDLAPYDPRRTALASRSA